MQILGRNQAHDTKEQVKSLRRELKTIISEEIKPDAPLFVQLITGQPFPNFFPSWEKNGTDFCHFTSKFKHKRLSLVPQILTVNQVVDHKNLLLCQGVNLLWHAHVDRRCHCIRSSGGFTISRRCGHCFVAATASYTANTSRRRWCGWHGWWGASCPTEITTECSNINQPNRTKQTCKTHIPPPPAPKKGKSNNTKLQSDQELTLGISTLETISDSWFTFINLVYYTKLSNKRNFLTKL